MLLTCLVNLSLTEELSVRLRTKWLWVRIPLMSLKSLYFQKQPSRGVPRKSYSENYVANPQKNTHAEWVVSCKFAAYFQNTFSKNTSGGNNLLTRNDITINKSANFQVYAVLKFRTYTYDYIKFMFST